MTEEREGAAGLPCEGMTLRQWYAGQAIALASCVVAPGSDPKWVAESVAAFAFAVADAMIGEGKK